jgi:hypothetical protein
MKNSGGKRRNELDAVLEAIDEARKILGIQPGTQAAQPWDSLVSDLERWRSAWLDLDGRIKAADRNGNADEKTVLLAQQKALLPRRGGPDGPVIRALRLPFRQALIPVRRSGGQEAYVENEAGSILRVDVHARPGKDGTDRFLFVPVYRHQLADPAHAQHPPVKAPVAHENSENWEDVSRETFHFSLYDGDLLLAQTKHKTSLFARFKTFDVSNAMVRMEPLLPHLPKISAALKRDARSIVRIRLTRLGLPEGRPTAGPEAWLWRGKVC